jgi:hypothetical protein
MYLEITNEMNGGIDNNVIDILESVKLRDTVENPLWIAILKGISDNEERQLIYNEIIANYSVNLLDDNFNFLQNIL